MNNSGRQSHLCFIRVCISVVLQLSFSFLRNQTLNPTDSAGITDPNLPQKYIFLLFCS